MPLVRLRAFTIQNSGSLQNLQMRSPVLEGMHLETAVYFKAGATTTNNNHTSQRPQLLVSLDIHEERINLTATVNLTIALDEFLLRGNTLLHYNLQQFQLVTLQTPLSKHGLQCVSLPLQAI
jgi:hypothetical protein